MKANFKSLNEFIYGRRSKELYFYMGPTGLRWSWNETSPVLPLKLRAKRLLRSGCGILLKHGWKLVIVARLLREWLRQLSQ